MKTILLVIASLLLLSATGCGTPAVMTASRPPSYYEQTDLYSGTAGHDSLFSSDSELLSDEDVKRILGFHFNPQPLNRIAVMPMGQVRWFGWSDELDKAGTAVQMALIGRLKQSKSVYDASYLPTLLVPDKKSIGYLREAAARYQADLLLVYKASCMSYEKYKAFSPDKTKAYCNLEAILLDTRTGIVPFTILVNRTFTAEEQGSDMNFYETIRRAELKALESALTQVGDAVVEFLTGPQG